MIHCPSVFSWFQEFVQQVASRVYESNGEGVRGLHLARPGHELVRKEQDAVAFQDDLCRATACPPPWVEGASIFDGVLWE